MSLSPLELTAFVLWIISIIILAIGTILGFYFFKKSKVPLTIGLGSLCACWIVGRLFALQLRFEFGEVTFSTFNLEALIALNWVFWPIAALTFILGAISFLKKKLKEKSFVAFWLLITIFSIAAIYIAIYFIESNVGSVAGIIPFEGTALLFQDLFIIFSWAGFIFLIYTLEINYHVKTRYLFTLFSSFSLVFTIYAFGTGQGMAAEVMLFIISMAGLLAIWYFMTVATLGKLKRNLLSLTIGHLCMVFVYLLDTPLGKFMLAFLPEDTFILVPPILINLGLILYFNGIVPLAVEWKSVYSINPSGMQQKN